jgi:hypothetical protein
MLPLLLWRCPLCATDDALVQVERRLRPDLLHCRSCGAAWRVRRVPGAGFALRVTAAGTSGGRVGEERSLAEWYDALKATLSLRPVGAAALPLAAGETLYLASGVAELRAETTDPLFFSASSAPPRLDKREVTGASVGLGRLFLTDQRLAWRGVDGRDADFPLTRLASAHAVMDIGVTLLVDLRLYMVTFREESLLKVVTMIGLLAPQVAAATGHRIVTSHW